jgi:hypothetical protein
VELQFGGNSDCVLVLSPFFPSFRSSPMWVSE